MKSSFPVDREFHELPFQNFVLVLIMISEIFIIRNVEGHKGIIALF